MDMLIQVCDQLVRDESGETAPTDHIKVHCEKAQSNVVVPNVGVGLNDPSWHGLQGGAGHAGTKFNAQNCLPTTTQHSTNIPTPTSVAHESYIFSLIQDTGSDKAVEVSNGIDSNALSDKVAFAIDTPLEDISKGAKRFTCSVCGFPSDNLEYLYEHMKNQHKECRIKRKISETKPEMKRKKKCEKVSFVESKMKYVTVVCTPTVLLQKGEKMYKCSACDLTSDETESLYGHMKETHKGLTVRKKGGIAGSLWDEMDFIMRKIPNHGFGGGVCGSSFGDGGVSGSSSSGGGGGTSRGSEEGPLDKKKMKQPRFTVRGNQVFRSFLCRDVMNSRCTAAVNTGRLSVDEDENDGDEMDEMAHWTGNDGGGQQNLEGGYLVNHHEGRANNHEGRVNNHEGGVNNHDGCVNNHEGRVNNHEGRVNRVGGQGEPMASNQNVRLAHENARSSLCNAPTPLDGKDKVVRVIKNSWENRLNGEDAYKCSECGISSYKPRVLYNHMRREHKGCRVETLTSSKVEDKKVISVDDSTSPSLDGGGIVSILKNTLEQRSRGTPPYRCSLCGLSSHYTAALYKHMKRKHKGFVIKKTAVFGDGADPKMFGQVPVFVENVVHDASEPPSDNIGAGGMMQYKCPEYGTDSENPVQLCQGTEMAHVGCANQNVTHSQSVQPASNSKDMGLSALSQKTVKAIVVKTKIGLRYKCSECGFILVARSSFYNHARRCHTDLKIVYHSFFWNSRARNSCDGLKGITKTVRLVDIQDDYGYLYQCSRCGNKYTNKDSAMQHLRVQHKGFAIVDIKGVVEMNCYGKCIEDVIKYDDDVDVERLMQREKEVVESGKFVEAILIPKNAKGHKFKCSLCHLTSFQTNSLYKHMRRRHRDFPILKLSNVRGVRMEFHDGSADENLFKKKKKTVNKELDERECEMNGKTVQILDIPSVVRANRYKCSKCEYTSNETSALYKHMGHRHKGFTIIKKSDVEKERDDKSVYIQDLPVEKKAHRFKCSECHYTSIYSSSVNEHMKARHKGFRIVRKSDMKRTKSDRVNTIKGIENRNVMGRACGVTHGGKTTGRQDQEGRYGCSQCDCTSDSKADLYRHMSSCHRDCTVVKMTPRIGVGLGGGGRYEKGDVGIRASVSDYDDDVGHVAFGHSGDVINAVYVVANPAGGGAGRYKCSLCHVTSHRKDNLHHHMKQTHEDFVIADSVFVSDVNFKGNATKGTSFRNGNAKIVHIIDRDPRQPSLDSRTPVVTDERIENTVFVIEIPPKIYYHYKCSACDRMSYNPDVLYGHMERRHNGFSIDKNIQFNKIDCFVTLKKRVTSEHGTTSKSLVDVNIEGDVENKKITSVGSQNADSSNIRDTSHFIGSGVGGKEERESKIVGIIAVQKVRHTLFKCSACGKTSGYSHVIRKHARIKHKDLKLLNKSETRKTKMSCWSQDNASEILGSFAAENDCASDEEGNVKHRQPIDEEERHCLQPYKCSVCDYSSNWRSGLDKHMKRYHKGVTVIDKANVKIKKREAFSQGKNIGEEGNYNDNDHGNISDVKTTDAVAPTETSSQLHKCSACEFSSKYVSSVRRHIKRHHKRGARAVKIPAVKWNQSSNKDGQRAPHYAYTEMIERESNVKTVQVVDIPVEKAHRYKCSKCDRTSYSTSVLYSHMRGSHKGLTIVKKRVREKKTTSSSDSGEQLLTDEWNSNEDRLHDKNTVCVVDIPVVRSHQFKCSECDKTSDCTSVLYKHMEVAHEGCVIVKKTDAKKTLKASPLSEGGIISGEGVETECNDKHSEKGECVIESFDGAVDKYKRATEKENINALRSVVNGRYEKSPSPEWKEQETVDNDDGANSVGVGGSGEDDDDDDDYDGEDVQAYANGNENGEVKIDQINPTERNLRRPFKNQDKNVDTTNEVTEGQCLEVRNGNYSDIAPVISSYECCECMEVFASLDELDNHVISHGEEKSCHGGGDGVDDDGCVGEQDGIEDGLATSAVGCEDIVYVVDRKKARSHHLKCSQCNKTNYDRRMLYQHMMTHHKGFSISKETNNGEEFRERVSFSDQPVVFVVKIPAVRIPRYKCSKCDRSSDCTRTLYRHMTICHPDLNIVRLSGNSKQGDGLCVQIVDVPELGKSGHKYKCSLCDVTSKYATTLYKHMKNRHQGFRIVKYMDAKKRIKRQVSDAVCDIGSGTANKNRLEVFKSDHEKFGDDVLAATSLGKKNVSVRDELACHVDGFIGTSEEGNGKDNDKQRCNHDDTGVGKAIRVVDVYRNGSLFFKCSECDETSKRANGIENHIATQHSDFQMERSSRLMEERIRSVTENTIVSENAEDDLPTIVRDNVDSGGRDERAGDKDGRGDSIAGVSPPTFRNTPLIVKDADGENMNRGGNKVCNGVTNGQDTSGPIGTPSILAASDNININDNNVQHLYSAYPRHTLCSKHLKLDENSSHCNEKPPTQTRRSLRKTRQAKSGNTKTVRIIDRSLVNSYHYKCSECEHIFVGYDNVYTHMKSTHKGFKIRNSYNFGDQCDERVEKGNMKLKSAEVINVHGHGEKCYKCSECNLYSKYMGSVYTHIKRKHKGCKVMRKIDNKLAMEDEENKKLKTVYPIRLPRTGELRYKCSLCSYTSGFKSPMYRHMRSWHKGFDIVKKSGKVEKNPRNSEDLSDSEVCDNDIGTCNYDATDTVEVVDLKDCDNGNVQYKCSRCEETSSSVTCLYNHMKRKHKGLKIRKRSDVSVQIINVLDTGSGRYKCSECFHVTKSSQNLYRHMERKHKGFKIVKKSDVIEKQQRALRSASGDCVLVHDIITKEGDRRYRCSKCDKSSTAVTRLYQHIRRNHKGMTMVKRNGELEEISAESEENTGGDCDGEQVKTVCVVRVPNKETGHRYKCSLCPFARASRKFVYKHIRKIHAGFEIIRGDDGGDDDDYDDCDDNGVEIQHKQTMEVLDFGVDKNGTRRYKCSLCDETSAIVTCLYKHMRRKHGTFKLIKRTDLSVRVVDVPDMGNGRYKCSECDCTRRQTGNLYRHMQRKHPSFHIVKRREPIGGKESEKIDNGKNAHENELTDKSNVAQEEESCTDGASKCNSNCNSPPTADDVNENAKLVKTVHPIDLIPREGHHRYKCSECGERAVSLGFLYTHMRRRHRGFTLVKRRAGPETIPEEEWSWSGDDESTIGGARARTVTVVDVWNKGQHRYKCSLCFLTSSVTGALYTHMRNRHARYKIVKKSTYNKKRLAKASSREAYYDGDDHYDDDHHHHHHHTVVDDSSAAIDVNTYLRFKDHLFEDSDSDQQDDDDNDDTHQTSTVPRRTSSSSSSSSSSPRISSYECCLCMELFTSCQDLDEHVIHAHNYDVTAAGSNKPSIFDYLSQVVAETIKTGLGISPGAGS